MFVLFSNEDAPWKLLDLKAKLSEVWLLNSRKLISMGRGFYHVLLYSEVDKAQIWAKGSFSLKPSVLCLREWTRDFNMETQKSFEYSGLGSFVFELDLLVTQILSDLANLMIILPLENSIILQEFLLMWICLRLFWSL